MYDDEEKNRRNRLPVEEFRERECFVKREF